MDTATATPDAATDTTLRPLTEFVPLPGGLGPTSARTLARWCAVGTTVRGRVVKLRAVRLGGSWRTSAAWIEEFFHTLTDAATGRTAGGS